METDKENGARKAAAIAVCLLVCGAAGSAELYRTYRGYRMITLAEEALSADDPDKAEKYLEEVPPKSRYYKRAQSLLNDIGTAKRVTQTQYIPAINEREKYGSAMPDSDEICDMAQDGLADYIRKLADAGEYDLALDTIEKLSPSLKNKRINDLEREIYAKRSESCTQE